MSEPETTVLALPTGIDSNARAWLLAGSPPGPAPRAAASVCLLRDDPAGVQVHWITRGHTLAVAPGQLAFPGGAVEAVDRRQRRDGAGPADRFMVLARAAARELAEETGHRISPSALQPLVRWVTPEHEPRRYDSTFLVGVLGDEAPGPTLGDGEVHEHGWATPADLLHQIRDRSRVALPPTRAVLARLAAASVGVNVDAGAGATVRRLVAGAILVPVIPRATWRSGDDREPEERGVDLLLPRHAGEVP